MHVPRPVVALTLTLLAALASTSVAAARPSARIDVCHLLTAKQATAVRGVSARCTNARPTLGPGSSIYMANWKGAAPRSSGLQVTVSRYTDDGMLRLATRNLGQGLPAAPKKVSGIGSAAYEANGAFSTGIRFAVGKEIVLVVAAGAGKPSWSTRSVEAAARAIAGRL